MILELDFFALGRPLHIADPLTFIGYCLLGLVSVLVATIAVDKLGTAMFRRGFAKPFYIKGRRIHHKCIYTIMPLSYGIICTLYILGYLHFFWSDFSLRLFYSGLVCAACIAVDFIGDKFWPEIRKNVILHHEWIYALIPAFFFTYVVYVVI